MSLPHPSVDQIELANVLAVLGDQTRLAVVGYLALNEGIAVNCGQFLDLSSKTNLSYHLAKLREAGAASVRIEGLRGGDWVLLDAGDVIVHLFRPEVRAYYNIEKIWSVDSAHTRAVV